ncbi:MAG: hypothetical protein EOP10_07465 [Proteobacteria bacterium]|nr:MAG: hypothetical protein EOP10_07465 [Pseudomonadota bacterium]
MKKLTGLKIILALTGLFYFGSAFAAESCDDGDGTLLAQSYCKSFYDIKTGRTTRNTYAIANFESPLRHQKIKDSLDIMYDRLSEVWRDDNLSLSTCADKYADHEWVPKGGTGTNYVGNSQSALWLLKYRLFATDDFDFAIFITPLNVQANADNWLLYGQVDEIGIGQFPSGITSWDSLHLNFHLNIVALDNPFITTDAIAGTMLHEMLHRVGYTHNDGYKGSVIDEMGNCLTRHNADRPALSGSEAIFSLAPGFQD